jgi:hypothetical protein
MKNQMKICITFIISLFYINLIAQKSSYVVTSTNDTVFVDKVNILNNKVKVVVDKNRSTYSYDQVMATFDFKKEKHFEKISPAFVEYKRITGNTFFAERLTVGKVRIYKYLTNQGRSLPIGNQGSMTVANNSFYTYFIGIEGSRPELLCYNELQLTKDDYKILKLYLHSNDNFKKELENLFFEEKKEKENSVIELVNNYNQWAALGK